MVTIKKTKFVFSKIVLMIIFCILCFSIAIVPFSINAYRSFKRKNFVICDVLPLITVKDFNEKIMPDDGNNSVYTTNSFLDFYVSFTGVSKANDKIDFVGDCVTFSEQDFVSIHYLGTRSNCNYVFKFKKEGDFVLKYELGGFSKEINFVVQDNNRLWDGYKYIISDIFSWSKKCSIESIKNIQVDYLYQGVNNGLNQLFYSNDKSNIGLFLNYLLSRITKTNSVLIEPGTPKINLYFVHQNSNKYSITFIGKYLFYEDNYYILDVPVPTLKDNCELRYSFIVQQSSNEVTLIRTIDGLEKRKFKYLYDLIFVPNYSANISTEASYICNYGDENIEIYSPILFKYRDVFFDIISSKNFKDIFK